MVKLGFPIRKGLFSIFVVHVWIKPMFFFWKSDIKDLLKDINIQKNCKFFVEPELID